VTIESGTLIGKYVVRRKLAEGGMAEIYLASARGPEGFEKEVVIKRIRSFLATDSNFVDMFIAEARLVSRLNHANLVQIFDFDKHEDSYYLAMEYVRGHSLYDVRRRARETMQAMRPALVAHVGAEVARGLHYAHRLTDKGKPLNLVHRDVTPHNVLCSYDGAVKLTDFGVAKAGNSHTAAGVLKGKFAYMSPEQSRGDPVDSRTDVFALGIVLWEMLTGGRLFDGDSDVAVLRAVQQSAIAPPARLNPDVSPELDAIVMRALERDPAARFQTAGELERALASFVLQTSKSIDDTDLGAYLRTLFAEEVAAPGEMTMTRTPVTPSPQAAPPREPTQAMRKPAPEGGQGSPVVEVDPKASLALSPDEDAHGATYVKPGLGSNPGSPGAARKGTEISSPAPSITPATTVPDKTQPPVTVPTPSAAAIAAAPTVVPPAPVRGGSRIAIIAGALLVIVAVGASSFALRGKLTPAANAQALQGAAAATGTSSSPAANPSAAAGTQPAQPAPQPPATQPATAQVPPAGTVSPGANPPAAGSAKPEMGAQQVVAAAAKPPAEPNPAVPPTTNTVVPAAGAAPSTGAAVTPAVAAAPTKGTLVLNVLPFGTVWIDGKLYGEVEKLGRIPLLAGSHRIMVKYPADADDADPKGTKVLRVPVKGGETIRREVNFLAP